MNKKIVIVLGILVVGLISLLGFRMASGPTEIVVQGDVRNTPDTFTNGAEFGLLPVAVNWAGGIIPAGQNNVSWVNNTGEVQYVDYVEMSPNNTASSTFKLFAYSTTTAYSVLYDITATPANNSTTKIVINGFNYATSSTATTTSNMDLTTAGKTLRVADGARIQFLLRGVDLGCVSQGGFCETATSTNRGFNIPWRVRYHD